MPEARPIVTGARTIEEVLARLSDVVAWSTDAGSRRGYFPALYRAVTARVRDGIAQGAFDDAERMEALDVVFANRYLDALAADDRGERPGRCWAFAFDTEDDYWPIVLQHLLLGMNAHINVDLGVAAAEVIRDRGQDPEALHPDFDRINGVLAAMIDHVQRNLEGVWAPLRILNRALGSVDDRLIEFSMERARDEAWRFACELSRLPGAAWPGAIAVQDDRMLRIAGRVRGPGIVAATVTRIVRLGEVQRVSEVVRILSRLG